MLDLVNLNIGGSGFGGDRTYAGKRSAASSGVTRITPPRPQDTEEDTHAKRIIKAFDVASFSPALIARAIWDHSSDEVKVYLFGLADALLDVAADRYDRGRTYSLVEREIGINSSQLKRFLKATGYLTEEEE